MTWLLSSVLAHYCALPILKRWIQPIRLDGPQSHLNKQQIPTMGGVVILGLFIIFCTMTGQLFHPLLRVMLGFGAIGLIDDVLKVIHLDSKGLSMRKKFVAQWCIALSVLWAMPTDLNVFGCMIDLGALYPLFGGCVLVGSANAYNLTDGLDGLAASQGLILLMFFGVVSIGLGQNQLAELCIGLWAILFGFYWVNQYPARLFMGDVGSLAIGGGLGLLSILLKIELIFAGVAFILVLETLSVVIQVYFFKRGFGRVFKMAPFHHHLELSGWSEVKIVRVFSAITLLTSLGGLCLI